MPGEEQKTPTEIESLRRPTYAEELNQKLDRFFEEKAVEVVRRTKESVSSCETDIIPRTSTNVITDTGKSFSAAYSLRESGLLSEVIHTDKGTMRMVDTNWCRVLIDRFSDDNCGLRFDMVDGSGTFVDNIDQKIRNSNIVKAIGEFQPRIDTAHRTQFKLLEDPLLSAVILERLGFIAATHIEGVLSDPEGVARSAIVGLVGQEKTISRTLENGITITLERQSADDNWLLSLSIDKHKMRMETADQGSISACDHLLDRETGKALLGVMEETGLRFNPSFEEFVVTGTSDDFSKRYGGAFTQISRSLAKAIFYNDPLKLSEIFCRTDGSSLDVESLRKFAQKESSDHPTLTLQRLISQIIEKSSNKLTDEKDYPEVSIRKGACFDVAGYYAEAGRIGSLKKRVISDTNFLYKSSGEHTLINLTEFKYRGVVLPRGCLFVYNSERNLAFLRLTPLTFDTREDMVSAFGSEVIKAEDNEGNPNAMADLLRSFQQS